MKQNFATIAQDNDFAVAANGKPLQTPQKKPLVVPSQKLADAIRDEWQEHQKFGVVKMPLTATAFTAIDRIGSDKEALVEMLLVYVDTDTLAYRATGSDKLAAMQAKQWDPIIAWAKKTFGATWVVTAGVMPVEQPAELHEAIRAYLMKMDCMRLAAAFLLSSGYSSVMLAIAVVAGHVDALEAFRLSRLEEESQAEAWGRDDEAEERAERLKDEIVNAARFLSLLQAA